MRLRPAFAVVLLSLLGCGVKPPSSSGPVTLAVVNARIWTGDSARPWADGLAVRGDRIAAVGSSAEIRKLARDAEVIDAGGMMLVPGFIDAHVHFIDGGFRLSSVQLRDATTPAEFIARIKAFAATVPKGTWISGGDWDHERWGGELPTRAWIDSVSPDHPVWLNRLDGHMKLANSAALAAAGVSKLTADVGGGTIVRLPSGEPAGIFKDNAMELIDAKVPDPSPALEDRALDTAMTYVASHGVTSVHNVGSANARTGSWNDLVVFQRAKAAGRLRTRIYSAVPLSTWQQLRDTIAVHGRGDAWLKIGGLKGFVDGSLGSHTAAMFAPFTDAAHDSGFFVTAAESLYAWTAGADKAGLQVMVHAIGDRAIATQLDIFTRVARENGPRDRRFRIEHAQHIAPADIRRFKELDVVASMQPYHAIDDGRWADGVIGPERAKGTYAFRSLLDAKARLAFGSDWFVAPPIPLEGIYAAVTRRTLDDRRPGGWVPEQKISVEEALRAYTSGSAYAAFDEHDRGILRLGMLADFVVLDRDLTKIAVETIRDVQVMRTVVGGKTVFQRP